MKPPDKVYITEHVKHAYGTQGRWSTEPPEHVDCDGVLGTEYVAGHLYDGRMFEALDDAVDIARLRVSLAKAEAEAGRWAARVKMLEARLARIEAAASGRDER